MEKLREKIQDYLSVNYPHSRIDTEHSLAGSITIRFDATGSDNAEAEDRVNETVERATLLWHKLFDRADYPIWVIGYEYYGQHLIEYEPGELLKHFLPIDNFAFSEEILNTRVMEYDEHGNELFGRVKGRILVGEFPKENIHIEGILRGIANRDNGFDPVIGQSVYFLDPLNHTGFHLYDDRGFFVWANEAKHIKELYTIHKDWVPGYTKEDIKDYFD